MIILFLWIKTVPYKTLRFRFLNLKNLILLLAFFVAFITLVNGLYASYKVQKI